MSRALPDDREHLALLLRVNTVLRSTRSLEEVMEDLIEEVISSLGAQRGFVVLRQGDDWRALATHYKDPSRENPDLRFSRTIVEQVASSGQPLVSADAFKDPRYNASSITIQKIRSVLCAPLRWAGQVQGVVYADHNVMRGVFTETQLALFSAIADQASRKLEMAALHQQLQQIHQRITAQTVSSPSGDAEWEAQAGGETVDILVESFRQGQIPRPAPLLAEPGRGLVIRLFGPFQVHRDGSAIENWSTRKNRDVLAYLASQGGQPVHEDKLMDLFWSEGGKKGLHSLHNCITQLRRTLGDRQMLQRQLDGYALAPAVWVDLDEFYRDFREGKRAAREQRWEEAQARLGRAEALAEGEFLEGNQAEWTFAPRQRVSEELQECRGLLAEHFSQRGKHIVAVELWKRVLHCDNCSEQAYRGILQALGALGRRAEAARYYQMCVKAYADELDLEPPEDLRALLDF